MKLKLKLQCFGHLTHWKRPWCWERLKARGEGDDRGGDGWMASLTPWTWVWVSSGSWWRTGKPGVLQSMGVQRVGHDWAAEMNWTELKEGSTEPWRCSCKWGATKLKLHLLYSGSASVHTDKALESGLFYSHVGRLDSTEHSHLAFSHSGSITVSSFVMALLYQGDGSFLVITRIYVILSPNMLSKLWKEFVLLSSNLI